jgi:hypothetical protein
VSELTHLVGCFDNECDVFCYVAHACVRHDATSRCVDDEEGVGEGSAWDEKVRHNAESTCCA